MAQNHNHSTHGEALHTLSVQAESPCCGSCTSAPKHDEAHHHEGEEHSHASSLNLAIICAAVAIVAWLGSRLGMPAIAVRVLYALAIAVGGWPLLRGAWNSLRARNLDMNVLMTTAIIGACILGDWAEAATLVVLYTISETIEEYCVRRSRQAIKSLMQLSPPRALIEKIVDNEAQLSEVDANDVNVGDIFLVRAGERLALDGVVVSGSSHVNQAPVTGESVPVFKQPGDEVFAGTLNEGEVLRVRSTRPAQEGTVARIARLVSEAAAQKSPRQRTVERFAQRYTPIVMVAAMLVALVPPLLLGKTWGDSIYLGLALLVAACPCAFVLSGPVASVAALSSAARAGVLIRGSSALETLAHVRSVALDKTGTLTHGTPYVTDFISLNGVPRDTLIAAASAVEQQSEHPLARAVVRFAESENIATVEASEVREVGGQGVSGTVEGSKYRIGRADSYSGVLQPHISGHIQELQSQGRSVSLMEYEPPQQNGVAAVIGFADRVRPAAANALTSLKELGIHSLVVLSGDHAAAVEPSAREVGASSWRAGLLPEEKLSAIRELSQQHGTMAMVGDGINDAPALALADVGVAMGTAGSDVSIEVADVALMSDDLEKLPWTIRLARRAIAIISQNLALALGLKLVFMVGLFWGIWGSYGLIGGVIADVGATLLVTANSLRLLRVSAS